MHIQSIYDNFDGFWHFTDPAFTIMGICNSTCLIGTWFKNERRIVFAASMPWTRHRCQKTSIKTGLITCASICFSLILFIKFVTSTVTSLEKYIESTPVSTHINGIQRSSSNSSWRDSSIIFEISARAGKFLRYSSISTKGIRFSFPSSSTIAT